MNSIKYFFQFIIIILFLIFFKLLGLNYSTFLSGKFLRLIGPLFRSNRISHQNLIKAFPNLNKNQRQKILDNMWNN